SAQNRLRPAVHQAIDSRGGVVGVQYTENKMSSQACIRGDARSLEITNFPDHNNIRRLAQDRAQRSRKCHPNLRTNLHLVDSVHLIFNRLFYRNNFTVRFVDVIKAGVKRGRLAAAGWAGDEKNALGKFDQALEYFLIVGKK